jgi:CheY-like chemotaxis protein
MLAVNRDVNLLLTDIMMPFMNGWTLIDAVRSDPELADLPIVVMTAGLTPSTLPPDLRLLSKPFGIDALVRAVQDQCARHRPEAAP